MDLSQHDPTGRFSELAEAYARCRPDYPASAIDFVIERCRLQAGNVLVDVGCGTGISTRLFAARGLRVVGIEPNPAMRRQAEADPFAGALEYREGRAEATGLSDAFADAVLSAQAFHWFKAELALREFHRVLKPGGCVILVWNERDEADPFTAAYGEVIRSTKDAAALEQARHRAGERLLASSLFVGGEPAVFPHAQALDEAGVLGRALSVSYAPTDPEPRAVYQERLQHIFARFERRGQVLMRYRTTVYTAQRNDVAES